MSEPTYDYDVICIGCGSAGHAFTTAAASYGVNVAVFDHVSPTPKGHTWGVGGTCVSVGCVPKKMLHLNAITHRRLLLSEHYKTKESFDFDTAFSVVRAECDFASATIRKGLEADYSTTFFPHLASLVGPSSPHAVQYVDETGERHTVTATHIIVSVGLRPRYLDVPGSKQFCVTSDDLFAAGLSKGKVLVIGASYIALESAGLLAEVGFEVEVMVRSVCLRGFDRDMADRVVNSLRSRGVTFIHKANASSFEQGEEKAVRATFLQRVPSEDGSSHEVEEHVVEYDHVLQAIGRDPVTASLNLEASGVKTVRGKIVCGADDCSSVPHIYALGDVRHNTPELTPVAIRSAKMLASRLYMGSDQLMDYDMVPTTVFTPLEYGSVGPSEEQLIASVGEDNIEVYHSEFKPYCEKTLEFSEQELGYVKLITERASDKLLAAHYCGPDAAEIMQFLALHVKLGLTKAVLDGVVGIHPSSAEMVVGLVATKRSMMPYKVGGC
eukprot:gnl/Dysnectes_brevis/640_a707_4261.p1 GENE.gnl/Dysnectes_brevis/640_a707_4261~~gnl/Dysnectes_brevis/640_a707_4261.p1  ORF type:complete len:503 (-),score=101.44 gnl/Dysnectes_brevis/640_a707_4261:265-1752(-)